MRCKIPMVLIIGGNFSGMADNWLSLKTKAPSCGSEEDAHENDSIEFLAALRTANNENE